VGPGPLETLTRAFLAFRQRLGRALALLQHFDRIGVESAEEYRHWCRAHRFSAELGKSARWRPETRDPRRQFASLARHLLTRYALPDFMDAAWFRGRGADAQRQQSWFVHLGLGGNIRAAEGLPLRLTKRMAHCFTEAPSHLTIEAALRWAQIVGQGGQPELVEAILDTPLGAGFEHESFWATVIAWWVKHPELDADMVAPVYDYIQYRKFEPREIAEPGGEFRVEQPPEPNFSMKSRSVPKLMEAIDAWHIQLSREARSAAVEGWPKTGIPEFEHVDEDPETGNERHWRIAELRTHKELLTEGREMRHCVSSYARRCRAGKDSIWSLQVSDGVVDNRRLMTIALDPRRRLITQVRGRLNLTAHSIRSGRGGSEAAYAALVDRGRAIFKMWTQANRLRQSDGRWVR
jgi:hypothetical protein